MARIDLKVPFAEKDSAKQLGARWDSSRKVWYVPDGVDPDVFERWMEKSPFVSVRMSNHSIPDQTGSYSICSESYLIAKTLKNCWKCKGQTLVSGFILPDGFMELGSDDDGEEAGVWYQYDEPVTVFNVTNLLPSVSARLKEFSRHHWIDYSNTEQCSYWMNHCELCSTKQGDFYMFEEPGGAFCPVNKYSASRITLYEFFEPFACNGSTVHGDLFIESMRRVDDVDTY